MKRLTSIGVGVLLACSTLVSGDDAVRTIHLRQDDAQVRYVSKIYQLKHASAEEILPFINSAVKRYSRNSSVRRITTGKDAKSTALLVSTGKDFITYVDEIVAALDRPGKQKNTSAINGTGVTRIGYTPKYRAASELANIINVMFGSSAGAAFVNAETNTIFWRDQKASAENTLKWIERLDRPLPQVTVRINYYELRDSDLKDWGFDYLAWKNGPGVNLLNVGYNTGKIAVDELIQATQFVANSSWGFGGFFTAPQFDMSFIRCLQQSGSAAISAQASLTMINTPVTTENEYAFLQKIQMRNPDTAPFLYRTSLTPEYQNLSKNVLGRTLVGKSYYEDANGMKHSCPPELNATIINPFVCLNNGTFVPASAKKGAKTEGCVIFSYALNFKDVVERGNTGSELSNSATFTGGTTLPFGKEKMLALYEKENDVEQTIGLPILCRIPWIKYLFSTVTSIKERTYIVVTAEAIPVNPDAPGIMAPVSASSKIDRRIEKLLDKDNSK